MRVIREDSRFVLDRVPDQWKGQPHCNEGVHPQSRQKTYIGQINSWKATSVENYRLLLCHGRPSQQLWSCCYLTGLYQSYWRLGQRTFGLLQAGCLSPSPYQWCQTKHFYSPERNSGPFLLYQTNNQAVNVEGTSDFIIAALRWSVLQAFLWRLKSPQLRSHRPV